MNAAREPGAPDAAPSDACLPDLFEWQVEQTPAAVAVVAGVDRISYRELNARANLLAHRLAASGVGPEAIVGIRLEPGVDAVVALWAVLKTGAAYLPIDVSFPTARIEASLAAAGTDTVITAGDLVAGTADGPDANPVRDVHPDNAALVIFTSGSTGSPKGVVLVHRGLVNAYRFWDQEFALRGGVDSHCQVTSFAFAVFHADVIRAHCSGGKLVLCTPDVVTSAERLYTVLRDEQVRYVEFVPVILRNLLDWVERTGESLSFLRIAVVSSDRWYVREHRRLQLACGPGTRCMQSFGATETSIDTARFDAALDRYRDHELMPIGRPFPNVAVHIVDEQLRPVPPGATGEMLIGGAGVARGFLSAPGPTAERFLPDPIGGEPGARLYRTGDMARLLPGGIIQFVGREDAQHKIRGFRVELGEVEAALEAHDGVRLGLAAIRDDDLRTPLLVGYLVPADPADPPSTSELRRFVSERLPDYMVPEAFVSLDAVPQTPTGKVDRNALPDPPAGRPDVGEFVAPRTAVEGVVASIWAEVLGVDEIGVHDDFFDLGGQSMTAAQVLSRIEDAFGVRLALREAFDFRTVAELAARVADPPPNELAARPALVPRTRERRLRASFAQGRLWFLDQLQPGDTAYNITSLVTFEGPCDPAAIERAVDEVVRRHEALRTTFHASDAGPVQSIAASLSVSVPAVDVSRIADAGSALREAVADEAQRPFDLETGPLIRARLLRLAPDVHTLVVGMHHIVSDGWSLRIFEREVKALHAAFAAGRASPLEPLPVQYADYALWQRQWLQGPVLEHQLAYWVERLAGAPALTALPADRPRRTVQTHAGATWFSLLPTDLAEALDELARRCGATRFMTLLTGFLVLVSRLSGAGDLVVGTPTANRRHPDAELLIGCFANTLALRVDLSANPSFRELLGVVREEVLAAHRNQDVPFERVVDAVRPDRSLGHHPVFQIMFALQEPAAAGDGPPDLPAEPLVGNTQFDLSVSVQPTPHGIVVTWEYATDLFDHSTVVRFAGHLETLLAAAVARPESSVGSLDLLTESQRRELLVDFNDTAFESGGLVHELFDRRTARTPGAVAVADDRTSLTYDELNRQANRMAHALIERGVAAEATVAICVERSVHMVTAMLAVLKAGGLYLPLDPSFPKERIAFALADARARLLITERTLAGRLPEDGPPRLDLGAELSAYPDGDPAVALDERNALALIYTSGSTGPPKAATITHGAVVSLAAWSPAVLRPDDLSGVVAVSSICFDLSLLEVFATLIRGGRVLVARDALDLTRGPAASEARFLATFPAIAAELLEARAVPPSLRTLNLGGEPFPRALVDRVYAETGVTRVHNMYGPTEDTVYSTYELLPRKSDAPPRIGRPIGNTRVYVLDSQLHPVPVGVTGEVYLAGKGVGRGYFGRPALTAAAFPPDPFAELPGERMYRTGDLGRHTSTGSLEFVGRADDQVKVRGYRIELGEVESVLSRHPDVVEVAAAVHGDEGGQKRLVAYVVLAGEAAVSANELAAGCAEALPRWMVPDAFVPVPALPLKPNGKVDRRRLPAPDAGRLRPDGLTLPRSATEELIVGIWSELLPGARIGVTDNFFHLGGHSLLAARVLARIREAFGAEVSLREFFEAPTPAGLAGLVQSAAQADEVRIEPARRDRPLPLSFAQQRLWWLDQLHPGTALYNVTLQVRLPGTTSTSDVAAALEDVIRRHEVLRTTFAATGGTPQLRIGAAWRPNVAVIDARSEPDAWERAAREAEAPFDLERGPLLRACLVRVDERLALMQLTMHHIVTDGWSQGILLEELRAVLERAPGSIPRPPVQYADYATWQHRHMSGDVLERRLGWWAELLGPDPPRCELPADRPRPAVPDHRGAGQTFAVPEAVAARLLKIGAAEGATAFMTLLAAFAVFAHRVTGQDRLVLGTVTANRTRPETERLIGLFVNTLALPIDLSGDPTFRRLLDRVRDTALGAYANQDLPYDKLVERLAPARSTSRDPLVDVMFVMQNAVDGELAEAPSPTDGSVLPGVAKFDLTVTAAQDDDGLVVSWEYSRALFDDATILRFWHGFLRVLEGVAADPDVRIGRVSLLSAGDRDRLVNEWSGNPAGDPPPPPLPVVVERAAAAAPGAVAIATAGEAIAYGALCSRVNRMARLLRGRGVGRESHVAVCLDRSPRQVVAFLAVLAAGGSYLPLDPGLPAARLDFMIEDADAHSILTEPGLAERFSGHKDSITLVDDMDGDLARYTDDPLGVPLDPAELAYVIYTSGTTGVPKGAMIDHRGLSNLVLTQRLALGLTSEDRVLQLSSPSFDAWVFEIAAALGAGATLCMAQAAELLPGAALERTIGELGVTAAVITPAALTALDPEAVPSLRTVVAGGEKCSHELARAWAGGRRMFNAYGPSETTVWATVAPVDGRGRPPIGRPVANARTYVLDAHMEPVPVGVVGELYVGGAGVGRGYLRRPLRTAAAYVPDPFSGEPGARLYRTGDLCRLRDDGSIEYVGRRDDQVKLRGFRIELGEIESVLGEHPSVRAVVARVVDEGSRRKRLVAYAVPEREEELDLDALRDWMAERLPAYMVPATVVELERLPITPTGKVDRSRLPVPEPPSAAQADGRTPLDDPVGSAVAVIWADCLGIEAAHPDDDFFELGGHSLLAAELLGRISAAFGVEVGVPELFAAPTARGLAAAVLAALSTSASDALPPLEPVARQGPIPLTPGQARIWAATALRAGGSSYNVSGAVRLSDGWTPEIVRRALNELVRRHAALRMRIVEVDGRPAQVVEPDVRVDVPTVDLTATGDARQAFQEHLAALRARRIQLDCAPLIAATLFRLPEGDRLAIVLPHIVADGWSVRLLFRELLAVAEAMQQGLPSPLPPLAVQFPDWVLWQRRSQSFRQAELAFWRDRLAGLPDRLELAGSRPRAGVPLNRGRSVSFVVDAGTTGRLRSWHRREGSTLFMALLAAYAATIHARSGATDLAIATDMANRKPAGAEALIGLFINQVVLRLDLRGADDPPELLRRARRVTAEAYARQTVPFEEIVDALAPRRDPSVPPLAQVKLVLENTEARPSPDAGDSVGEEAAGAGADHETPAQLDLTLYVHDLGDRLRGLLVYDAELFDAASAEAFAREFEEVLEEMVAGG